MKPIKYITQLIARLFSRNNPYEPVQMYGVPLAAADTSLKERRERQSHMVQRRTETGTATGRVSSTASVKSATPKSDLVAEKARKDKEWEDARRRAREQDEEETRRRNASSFAQSSPAFNDIWTSSTEPERDRYSPPATPAYSGGGGSFDGGGSSGDWNSSSSDSSCDSGSSSCDSGSSSSSSD